MKIVKKSLTLLLALAMTLSLASCGKETEQEPTVEETPVTTRVAALKGPTAMGMVKLMSDNEAASEEGGEADSAQNGYEFTLAASADEVTPSLMKGDLDIACVPANLACVLYNKTGGDIVTLAINTLGVLYVVENGNAVQSMADLTGKTIVASGKGSTPEYALRYLLTENGLNPDADVVVDWKSEHSECVAALASGAATIALLPQPFVTVAQSKMPPHPGHQHQDRHHHAHRPLPGDGQGDRPDDRRRRLRDQTLLPGGAHRPGGRAVPPGRRGGSGADR